MTAPVDVLAVMDRLAYALQDRAAIVVEVNAARAVVAELIEADKEYDAAELSGHCIRRGEAAIRRREALARVGGAA